MGLVLGLYFLFQATPVLPGHTVMASAVVPPVIVDDDNNTQSDTYGTRARRGGYRSPRSGYTGGDRTGVTPGRNPGANAPGNRAPGAPANRFGGFFGGLLAGGLIGSLFNPFGWGGTGGISILGILFWAVILYFAFRFFRRMFGNAR